VFLCFSVLLGFIFDNILNKNLIDAKCVVFDLQKNICDYSTSGRGEYFKQTLIIIFIAFLRS
jgi:hypothetical protein